MEMDSSVSRANPPHDTLPVHAISSSFPSLPRLR
jgi:hypothetical protein